MPSAPLFFVAGVAQLGTPPATNRRGVMAGEAQSIEWMKADRSNARFWWISVVITSKENTSLNCGMKKSTYERRNKDL
ncbi:hypothetical protein GCK72_022714 [Caenorhabditis remanei]|uniref:Uncharacterized protein n=1 Tax=Caenorhabditis remanei TaxID=31234 RepID=A0A6A5FV40_CAERE|nr:hypothetical protein GCK72_022714 [Caenorhabditis remanei]KAF1746261.1 hypothetical protein GCK72_022714 [Caenorhabditis remanei]